MSVAQVSDLDSEKKNNKSIGISYGFDITTICHPLTAFSFGV